MDIIKDDNSYNKLRSPNFIACDFCDKVFKNRYESIIHNATHIIIPLWIQTLYKCDTCNSYATSLDGIEKHKLRHIVTKSIENQNDINCSDNVSYREYKNIENDSYERNTIKQVNIEPIRNRIKFEDDFPYSNGLINDLVNECQVNIQVCDSMWLFPSGTKYYDESNKNRWKEIEIKEEISDQVIYTSVGYSSLIKPGIYRCKYCFNLYPNRFSLIKHETTHMRIDMEGNAYSLCCFCDKYIAGNMQNLNRHQTKHHPYNKYKLCRTSICKRCGLEFRKYRRHLRNHHMFDCQECGMEYRNGERHVDHDQQHVDHDQQHVAHDQQHVDHDQQHVDHDQRHVDHDQRHVDHDQQHVDHASTCKKSNVTTKIMRVCDLCCSFLKRRIDLKYHLIRETNHKMDVQHPCDSCGKRYLVLKIVKRIQKMKRCYRDHKSKLTNENRLKNIQHRFKKLNLLNKFYSVVSFFVSI